MTHDHHLLCRVSAKDVLLHAEHISTWMQVLEGAALQEPVVHPVWSRHLHIVRVQFTAEAARSSHAVEASCSRVQ